MKTRTIGMLVILAIAVMAFWAGIGRYDLAAIVALGNLPLTAMLVYRLWRRAP
jgi:hypothetical protein